MDDPLYRPMLDLRLPSIDDAASDRKAPRYCEACGASTREAKPFCSEHVDRMPYVQEITAAVAERQAEAQRAHELGKARPDGYLADDARVVLWQLDGTASVERIAREIAISVRAADAVAHALRRAGVVKLAISKRGITKVRVAS